jgi:hypothetical protein
MSRFPWSRRASVPKPTVQAFRPAAPVERLEPRALLAAASISAPDVAAEYVETTRVRVAYESAAGLDLTTIDSADLVVTGPGAAAAVVTQVFILSGNLSGTSAVAEYALSAPGGVYDASDSGTYTVALAEDAVKDLAGDPIPAATATFNVAVGPDVAPPTIPGSLSAFPAAGAIDWTVNVSYLDGQGIDVSTIDPSDLTVTGPAGPLAVTSVTLTPGLRRASVSVRYTVAAPGGTWDSGDAGRYVLSVGAGAVADAAGHLIAATTQFFDAPLLAPDDGPDLRVSLGGALGQWVLPGQADRVPVEVTNAGDGPLNGRVAIELRTWEGVPEREVVLATTPPRRMRLKPRQSRIVNVRFKHLQAPSEYNLVAVVDPANLVKETDEQFNRSEPGRYSRVSEPFTRLEPTSMGGPVGGGIRIGRTVVVPLRVRNDGNTTFRGPLNIDLFGSTNPNWAEAVYERLAETAQPRVVIPPNQSREFRVRLRVLGSLWSGRYTLKATINLPPAVTTDPNALANAAFTRADYFPTVP